MSIPGYLRRDMKRLYGETVFPFQDLTTLRTQVEEVLDRGLTPTLEGWALRRSGFKARQVAESIAQRRRLQTVHQRRGDLWLFLKESAYLALAAKLREMDR